MPDLAVTPPSTPALPPRVRLVDILERVFWAFVVGALTNLVGVTILGVEAWKGAVMAGLTAVINAILAIGRWRLSILPDPGAAIAQAARAQTIAEVNELADAA
jgi:hypothetical protein